MLCPCSTNRDHKAPVFPDSEKVPLDGVVRDNWQDLALDDKHGGGINRITYEWCLLTTAIPPPPPAATEVGQSPNSYVL